LARGKDSGVGERGQEVEARTRRYFNSASMWKVRSKQVFGSVEVAFLMFLLHVTTAALELMVPATFEESLMMG
jgi:hypothetical protein